MLLWVFSGQAQWLLFMTLCRGFMTGARQPPAQQPPAPRAQPPPRPAALGRAQAYAHAAHAADHAPLNTRTLLGVSLARISPTSRPHLARISPASRPHDGRHRRLRDTLRRGHSRRRRPRPDPGRADRPHLAQHHGWPRDERALLAGYIEPNLTLTLTTGPGPDPDLDPSPHPEPQR